MPRVVGVSKFGFLGSIPEKHIYYFRKTDVATISFLMNIQTESHSKFSLGQLLVIREIIAK